ncbi:hypothetical protein [Pseudosporangium ferrugineum]|uniref:Uncharacterized protein n=1 Tax=Pseudosporangium ferrugineum TaxID=439699 RepID=A0A2T0SBR2_9ACTN|nr:hypothetical protein [Pseudosporangium ferrugineum]PRY30860.1 hypothetical protein CLV70_104412 [Pseudosporangium ferrugineum]
MASDRRPLPSRDICRPTPHRPHRWLPGATAWLGWILFISIIMVSAGLITIAQGFVALLNEDFYQAPAG